MLLYLGIVFLAGIGGSAAKDDCTTRMKSWIKEQKKTFPPDTAADPQKIVYFLHIPRTAGRTTHNCFLMPSTAPSRRCAKSYDGFKYDISMPDCGLIASHDDFSAMMSLPSSTAVFTSIRDPLARFLSAYEFAVELGAREAARKQPMRQPDAKQGRTSTKEVWPWSYLQPFFVEDMTPKVQAQRPGEKGVWEPMLTDEGERYYLNRVQNVTEWEVPDGEQIVENMGPLKPYDNILYMPLRLFAEEHDAFELLHNGQTLQVLGLTNYSHDAAASDLRSCIINDRPAAELALDYALERLRSFDHVGTYESIRESLPSWALHVGKSLNGPTWSSNKQHAFSYDDGEEKGDGQSHLDPNLPVDPQELESEIKRVSREAGEARKRADALRKGTSEQLTADKQADSLMDQRDRLINQRTNVKAGTHVRSRLDATGRARQLVSDADHLTNRTVVENFMHCEANAQARAGKKRTGSLAKLRRLDGVSPVFSRRAREIIPERVRNRIRELNWMDARLHELASELASARIAEARSQGMKPLPRKSDNNAPREAGEVKAGQFGTNGSTTPGRQASSVTSGAASHDEL